MKPVATTRSATGIPTGRLAVWWLIASEIVIFGGLLSSYVMHRLGHPEFGDYAAHTNTAAGAVNTFVLLTSSLAAVSAHKAAAENDGRKAARLLWLTVLGGTVFLGIKAYEWSHEIGEGLVISKNAFWGFYYTATGLHAVHVIAGMVAMMLIAVDAAKGRELQRVENVGLYWHFVDAVWIFLFPLLYIAK